MIGRFLRWLFKPAPRPVPAIAAPAPRSASFFTTDHVSTDEPIDRQQVMRRSVRVTPAQMRRSDGVALDSVGGGSLMGSAKSAFALSDGNMPDAQLLWFASQGFIGFQLCAILAQQWLIGKACHIPARDAARNGFKITGADAATLDKLTAANKRYGLKRHCVEFAEMTRVFGIRIAIFKVDSQDAKYYERPFNPDGITPGSYRGIVQVDPYWCVPELGESGAIDPASTDFYEPLYWTIQGRRYHRSHLVIARGPQVADLLKPSYMYAGISLPQRIYERVYAAERTANEGPQLALSKRTTVLYTDTEKALANERGFIAKLQKWIALRDNFGVKVLDKTGDQMEQIDTTLSDLDETIMTQYQLVAAIANVPATKLLGTTPKGFNATGDYEEANYHEELEAIQSADMEPLINRHHLCVLRSEGAAWGADPKARVGIEWNPLDAPTAKEEADTRFTNAQADKLWSEAGALDGQDIRNRLVNDKSSGYAGIDAVVPDDAGPHLPGPPVPGSGQAAPGGADGAMVALDMADWDPVAGTYAGAQLITNQTFIDDAIVAAKIVGEDFTVQVSPEFITPAGQRYRVILDGHHSLAAAVRCNRVPVFLEANYADSDYCNAVTQLPAFGAETAV